MTKRDIVGKLAEAGGITKKQADHLLTTLEDIVRESLQKGDKIVLPGIGSISCIARKAKIGRNPRTGEAMPIPAKRAAKFSLSTTLAAALNEKGKAIIDY